MKPYASRPWRIWLTVCAVAAVVAGAPRPGAASTRPSGARELALRDEIARHFTFEALSDRIVLHSRAGAATPWTVEIADDEDESVTVNGKEFSSSELPSFLDGDGELIARLLRSPASTRRSTLGLPPPAGEERVTEVPEVPETPAPPLPPLGSRPPRIRHHGNDRVSIGSSITVAHDEVVGDAVCIGCSVDVEGEATGNAVSIGGTVTVNGHVRGDAVAIGGTVHVADGAEVEGEGVSVGGAVEIAPGGHVAGGTSGVGIGIGRGVNLGGMPFTRAIFGGWGAFFWAVLSAGVLALLGCLTMLIARPAVEAAARRLDDESLKSIFVGLLTELLAVPVLILVTIVLAVSIIGIPLLVLIPVAILGLVVAAFVGYVAAAYSVGRWIEERFGLAWTSPFLPIIIGVFAIQGTSIVAHLVGIPGHWFAAIGFAMLALGWFLRYVAWTAGLGAAVMAVSARGWRRKGRGAASGGDPAVPAPASSSSGTSIVPEPSSVPPSAPAAEPERQDSPPTV